MCCTRPAEGCTCSVPISTTRVYRPIAPYIKMRREVSKRKGKERREEEEELSERPHIHHGLFHTILLQSWLLHHQYKEHSPDSSPQEKYETKCS